MTRVCGRLLLMKCIFASAVIAAVIVDDQIVPEDEFTDIVAADPMAHPTEDALPRSTVVAPVPKEEFTDTVPVEDTTDLMPSEDSDKPKPSSRPREEDLPAELISAESTSCSMKVCGCTCQISISASECTTVKATSQSSLKDICWDTPHDNCVDLSSAIPGVQMSCVGVGDETAWSTADLTSWTKGPLLKVTSGTACVIDSNECVTDGSGKYGNNERCTITAQADIKVSAKKLVTEDGYDYIEIAGHKYSGPDRSYGGVLKDVRMAKGATMKWVSDGSVGMDGFVICPTPVSSSELTQVSSQSVVQEDASVEQEDDDTQEEVSPAHSDRIGPNLFDWGGVETDLVQLAKTSKGRHDAQYVWASKAIAKSVLHASTCKPSTNGKEAPRLISCGRRLLSADEYQKHAMSNTTASRQLLGSCGCGSWTTVGPMCVQPCTEQGSHSHDTGLYCSEACNREGQVALREGCGVGHDRVCVKDAGACVSRHVDRTVAFIEMVMSIITLGGGAMAAKQARKQAKDAAKGGLKSQHSLRRLGSQLMGSAKSLAARAKAEPSGFIRQQLKKETSDVQDRILENGALLLLTANLPTNWGAVAWEIGAAVDPTGIVGFAKGFVPPSSSCNDEVYFKTQMPDRGDGLDYDALDLVPGRWGDADLPHIPDVEFSLIAQQSECQGSGRTEKDLGAQTSLKACAYACSKDATCKQYGTFIYGWGVKRGRCWAEKRYLGNKCQPERATYNTYVLGLYSKVRSGHECNGAEHQMGNGLSVDQCVTRCLNDKICKKYRTISLGIRGKAGRCFSEHMKYTDPTGYIRSSSGYCRSWKRALYDSYQIGSPYRIKSIRDFDILEKDVSCRNIHASTDWALLSTGKYPTWGNWGKAKDLGFTVTNTACFQKLQAKGYQLGQWSQDMEAPERWTSPPVTDHKHFCGQRRCYGIEAKTVHEMFGWVTDSSKWQPLDNLAVAVYFQKACPSKYYWTFTQHCPPSSPHRKSNRCYEFKWGGKMCNVDPKGDVPANRQDTPCECETRCDATYGSQDCPLAMPIRYKNNNRCFEYKWGGNACNVDPKNDPVSHQKGDTVVCNCAPTSETGVLPK